LIVIDELRYGQRRSNPLAPFHPARYKRVVMRNSVVLLLIASACTPRAHVDSEPLRANLQAESATSSRAPSVPNALRVAITFDDLGSTSASSEASLSRRILHSLAEAKAPVAVFANCQALTDATALLWRDAGATFGNHTATHLSLDAAGADEAWWHDVQSCEDRLVAILHQPVRYFRYPYLRYGKTRDVRAAAAQKLASIGLSVAHVTAATSEWLLAQYYEQAHERRDLALVRELAGAYVDHMVGTLSVARSLAVKKARRDVAQITLAHVNRLAADHLGDALRALREHGWSFISLEEALSDSIYAERDGYTGSCGCSWLARIEPALTPADSYAFGDEEDRIRERFGPRLAAARVQPGN
jgi:peptidoglycan/xylan/chitin deacetylase (PgdA/CDA1 family)